MEDYVKLNSQTAGKDKIARLFQYFSRVLWYHSQKRQLNPITVDKLKSLEYTLSTFRKLLRLGKSIEVFYAALKSVHDEDPIFNLTTTMSRISAAIFLLTDHILWFGRSGLAAINTEKWTRVSNKYWLYSIYLNIAIDFFKIWFIWKDFANWPRRRTESFSLEFTEFLKRLVLEDKAVFWDTVKNVCDVWIPLNSLGHTKFNPGVVGLLGTISSVAGLIGLIHSKA